MQDQFIFGHGDTDLDTSVPIVADAEDVTMVKGVEKPVVPTRQEMIKMGQQRRRKLGMPLTGIV